jgi:spore coat protein U-like protein
MKKRFALHGIALGALLASGTAQAAIACGSITATSVNGVMPITGDLNLTGNFTVTCTRSAGDPTTQVIYIGLDQGEPPAGRAMTRQTSADTMNYAIFRNATPSGSWTSGAGRSPGSILGGGLQVTITFTSASTTVQSFSYPYYFRVTAGNASGKPAGIYDDLNITTTVRLTSQTGAVQSTTVFGTTVSKPSHCYFSSSPTNMVINYSSFSPTAQSGTSNFSVSCTQSTPYTLALDATSGTLLGLNYSLSLSSTSATGTGFVQNFSVTGTVPAGQVGTCSTATCSASQTRVITVTY